MKKYGAPMLNAIMNKIHTWNLPEHNPMKRMFSSRLYETVCVVIEISILAFKTLEVCTSTLKMLANIPSFFWKKKSLQPYLSEIHVKASETGKYVLGLASTVFFGVVFSPEVNFKIHVKLQLVTDESAKRFKEELEKKLQEEKQKAEMMNLSVEQTLEETLQTKAEDEMQLIHSCLAGLI